MVYPIVMYESEIWTIKKAEHQRIDAFKLWCWRKFLSVPWTARISNQSILKEINPDYSLEGVVLKLKLWYFWPSVKSQLTGKDPDAGKDWGPKEKRVTKDEMVGWYHQLNGPKFEQTLRDSEGQGSLACCNSTGLQRVGHDWVTEQQQQIL